MHTEVARWMLFIDGENFAIRAQEIARDQGVELHPTESFERDVFIWPRSQFPIEVLGNPPFAHAPIRSYYYTATTGDEDHRRQIERNLWALGFNPVVFKKQKGRRSKGVDIALTTDLLSHAFAGNYDLAVLITGDADYLPAIEAVKRLGKIIYVAFHADADVNHTLRLAPDLFVDIPFGRFLSTYSVTGIGQCGTGFARYGWTPKEGSQYFDPEVVEIPWEPSGNDMNGDRKK
jgi:uncharacterized LabA/DUF88 family protein